MTVWIFPGQPLAWDARVPDDQHFSEICELCRKACGYDPATNSLERGNTLSPHTMLQVYGVVMSLYRARVLRDEGYLPDLIAEHSLGIYAALAAAGSLSEGDALLLVSRLGSVMTAMSAERNYALGCVIGMDALQVEKSAALHGVHIANYNTSRHFLLSGEKGQIEACMADCQQRGAFSVSAFDCEAPLHSPMLGEIRGKLEAAVSDFNYQEPKVPLIEHICQSRLKQDKIEKFLVDELLQPVYWEKTWRALQQAGADRMLEVGVGQALTKFNRWIASEAAA